MRTLITIACLTYATLSQAQGLTTIGPSGAVVLQAAILLKMNKSAKATWPVSVESVSADFYSGFNSRSSLPVTIQGIETTDNLQITIDEVRTTDALPVSIDGISTTDNLPVSISDISTTDELSVNLENHDITILEPIPVRIER